MGVVEVEGLLGAEMAFASGANTDHVGAADHGNTGGEAMVNAGWRDSNVSSVGLSELDGEHEGIGLGHLIGLSIHV